MPTQNHVFGIIVTYNPQPDVSANVQKILPQVQQLIVVDNGSRPETITAFREIAPDIELVENGRNLGIAAALNRGVQLAKQRGAKWVCLFDQDSTPCDGFVEGMLQQYNDSPAASEVAIVTPKHINRDTREWRAPALAKDGSPLVAITSGSLMPIDVFDRCGMFEEDLIIDRVDEEYCLRVRSMGLTIKLAASPTLLVTVGSPKQYWLFGRILFSASHHSGPRKYYITRNRIVIAKRYWHKHPVWCYRAISGIPKDLAKICLVEQNKACKIGHTINGIIDGVSGRMGMIVKL